MSADSGLPGSGRAGLFLARGDEDLDDALLVFDLGIGPQLDDAAFVNLAVDHWGGEELSVQDNSEPITECPAALGQMLPCEGAELLLAIGCKRDGISRL